MNVLFSGRLRQMVHLGYGIIVGEEGVSYGNA